MKISVLAIQKKKKRAKNKAKKGKNSVPDKLLETSDFRLKALIFDRKGDEMMNIALFDDSH
uniref:Uncharacterized protein n=1 Tax=Romanomermis culicivorax TaxID=13658 RepID=A0A915J480_ROMCU